MTKDMHIRQFALDDYEAVYALWQRAGEGVHLSRSDRQEEIAKKLERDPDLFLVAEVEGVIVGAVMGGWDGRRGMVYHLAVDPACRRQGIGLALMEKLERRLKAKGCLKFYLLVTRDNQEGQGFYRQFGCEDMDDIALMGKEIA